MCRPLHASSRLQGTGSPSCRFLVDEKGVKGAGNVKAVAIVRLGVDVPYEQAWTLQRRLHARRAADEISDLCLILEHAPVYTSNTY